MTHPDQLAHEELAEVARRRPHLRSLIDKLTVGTTIGWGEAFHGAYRRSSAEGKALILRVLFDDVTLFKRGGDPVMTRPLAKRVRTYLQCLPSEPLRTGLAARDQLPKPFSRLFGLDRGSWWDVSNAVVQRLWPGGVDAYGVWPASVCAELMPLVEARLISEAEADRLIAHGLEAAAATYYFDVPGADAIAVRNMAVYLGRLFAHGRDGGREQNLISLQVARQFGIAPRSVPETLAICDVLALHAFGCLRCSEDDPFGIARIFDTDVPGGFRKFWVPALQPHLARGFVTDPFAPDDYGMYGSGFLFNVARMAGLVEGQRHRLEAFAPYYARADLDQLLRVGLSFWRPISPRVVKRCRAIAREISLTKQPAIRLRDLGNIVCMAEASPDGSALPSVARFALGEAEPVYTGRQGPRGPRERSRESARPSPTPLLAPFLHRLDGEEERPLRARRQRHTA